MKTFVVFIKSDLYDKDSFKCLLTNIDQENIILAHKHVYPDANFEIIQKIPIYDEYLFSYYIKKVPQYKSAFVTVSFNDNIKYESSKIPNMIFTNEQQDLIFEIIEYINKLAALLPLDNNTILNNEDLDNSKFIVTCSTGNENGINEIMGFSELEEYEDIYPIHYNCTDLYFIINEYNDQSVKYIIMNKGFLFDNFLFTTLFPELEIQIYKNFPNIPLADKMFDYQLNLYDSINCIIPLKDIVDNINEFLISKVQSIKISDIKETIENKEYSDNIHMKQYNIVKEFVENKCIYVENSKTQSSILFDHFTAFCTEKNQPIISHTKFSKLFKSASIYDTSRKSNGIFWINLELKD